MKTANVGVDHEVCIGGAYSAVFLKYGLTTLPLELDDHKVAAIVAPAEVCPLTDASEAVKKVLAKPYGTPPLLEMLKRASPQKLVIVVNDITRPTPYSVIMPPLLEILEEAGIPDSCITLVIATGIHEPHTLEQNIDVSGEDLCRRFKIISHNAEDPLTLVYKGMLPSGYDF